MGVCSRQARLHEVRFRHGGGVGHGGAVAVWLVFVGVMPYWINDDGGWEATQWQGITKRNDMYRVFVHSKYAGTHAKLEDAKAAVVTAGGVLMKDRSKRMSAEDFLVKAHKYMDWVVHTGYEPGDLIAAREFRLKRGDLVRGAPVTYQLVLEGKEAPWSRQLEIAYDSLSMRDKSTLLQLTSDVKSEFMQAAAIQHRIYSKALVGASRPAFHKKRKWWSNEVQFNVSQHMGWLSKALARGVLKKLKTRGSGVILGQMGSRYRIMPLTPRIAAKYKDMAVLTTSLAAMPTPRSFQQYQANRRALLNMPDKYHDLWYFRAFFELERWAAHGTFHIPPCPSTSVDEFITVFPDSVGYLKMLEKHYGSTTVVTVLKKLGYTKMGLPTSQATMHLCFIGYLHALDVRRVRKCTLKRATQTHKHSQYFGHPAKVFVDACRMESDA